MSLTKLERRQFFLLSFCLFATAVALIWVRTATVKKTYEYVQLEREYRMLREAIQSDRLQWVKVTSPKRLEKVADQLGLAPPKMGQVLKYDVAGIK